MPKGDPQFHSQQFSPGILSFPLTVNDYQEGNNPGYYVNDVHYCNQKNVGHGNGTGWPGKIIALPNHLGEAIKLQPYEQNAQCQCYQQQGGGPAVVFFCF